MIYDTNLNSGTWAKVTQLFGNGKPPHRGCDIVFENSPPEIRSARSGVVITTQDGYNNAQGSTGSASWGNMVKIRHSDGTTALYAHMQKGLRVTKGQTVNAGTVLGIMGNSGNSYGAHLHLEYANAQGVLQNPAPLMGFPQQKGRWQINYIGEDIPIPPQPYPAFNRNQKKRCIIPFVVKSFRR